MYLFLLHMHSHYKRLHLGSQKLSNQIFNSQSREHGVFFQIAYFLLAFQNHAPVCIPLYLYAHMQRKIQRCSTTLVPHIDSLGMSTATRSGKPTFLGYMIRASYGSAHYSRNNQRINYIWTTEHRTQDEDCTVLRTPFSSRDAYRIPCRGLYGVAHIE